jgi:hypothetical protein
MEVKSSNPTRWIVTVEAEHRRLEAALKCRSCRTPRYSPPVCMIKLPKEREIAAYVWVHPDDER